VKKQDEYRVHVGKRGNESIIIDVQQKRRRHDHAEPNFRVRNLANGFIYAREGVNPPECVFDFAKRALACCDLDFGAVDVIYNAREGRAYVLEINTAPGITGTTVERYRNYFRSL
jgi:glutathione synthase/RimK-type ligase-like ATP-grasp enzyme